MVQEDSSLTRSDAYFLDLLKRSGYTVTGSALQRNFPKGLFKVRLALLYRTRPECAVFWCPPPTSFKTRDCPEGSGIVSLMGISTLPDVLSRLLILS